MTEVENVILDSEDISQLTAKRFFKQVQSIRFVNKKIDAIGSILINTNDILDNLITKNKAIKGLVNNIQSEQGLLTDSTSQILSNWKLLIEHQDDETNAVNDVKTLIDNDIQSQKDQYEAILDVKKQNDDEYAAQLNSFQFKIDELNDSLSALDYSDTLYQLTAIIKELNDAAHKQQLVQIAQQEALNKTIFGLQSAVKLVTTKIESYDALLTSLNKRVKMVSLAIDAVDDKVTNIVPKSYDISSDDIIKSFTEIPLDESAVLQKSQDANVIVPEPEVDDEQQSEVESKVTSAQSVDITDDAIKPEKYEVAIVPETRRAKHVHKVPKWYARLAFWKK